MKMSSNLISYKLWCQSVWVIGRERRCNWVQRRARLAVLCLQVHLAPSAGNALQPFCVLLGFGEVSDTNLHPDPRDIRVTTKHCQLSTAECFSRADCTITSSPFLPPATTIAVCYQISSLVTSATGILPLTSTLHSLNWVASAAFLISFCWHFILSACSLSLRLVFASDFILASL